MTAVDVGQQQATGRSLTVPCRVSLSTTVGLERQAVTNQQQVEQERHQERRE
jgi:hypothetical protein